MRRDQPHTGAVRQEGLAREDRQPRGRIGEERDVWIDEAGLFLDGFLSLLRSGADDPVDRADGGNIVLVADALLEEPISDLPGEYAGVLLLVVLDLRDHVGRGHFRLAPTDHTGLNGASFVVPEKSSEEIVN